MEAIKYHGPSETDTGPLAPQKTVLRVSEFRPASMLEEISARLKFRVHRVQDLREMVAFLCYMDRAPDLIVLTHEEIAEFEPAKIIDTLKTLLFIRFPGSESRIAVRIGESLTKAETKAYKNAGVAGFALPADKFGYNLNLKCFEELLYGSGEYWPREGTEAVTAPRSTKMSSEGIALTERQDQVKRLLCERGLSNKAIARHLNISESTVKIHVSAILKRYAVRNRTQLALAVKNDARL